MYFRGYRFGLCPLFLWKEREEKMTKILETIGKTPLVQLQSIGDGQIYVKVEKTNPAGSIKDRPAYQMIQAALEDGSLKKGMTILEPTSGNMGIALALIGKNLGFDVVLVMPGSMSIERRKLMEAYGAKIVLTGEGGMQAASDKAKELFAQGGYFMPGQFDNPENVRAHELHTGPEIYEELKDIKGFVAGIGTGGTVTGVGHYLKKQDPSIQIWGLEPAESPLLSQGKAGGHQIQGIGANFVPSILDQDVLDKVTTVKGEDAIQMARRLAREEGLFVGISSGANVVAALDLQKQVGGPVVTVLPDTGERYLSTALVEE